MAPRPAKKTARAAAAAPPAPATDKVRRRKQFVLTEQVCKALEIRAATLGTEQSLLVEDGLRSLLGLAPLSDAGERKQ